MRYLIISLIIFLASCSKKEETSTSRKLTLQLNWFPEAEHGGYYEALQKGYYKELGLDVEILPGGPGVRVESETALGRADFGIANADKILTVLDKNMKLVALISPFNDSPRCLIYHADSGINNFEGLSKAKVLIVNNTKPYYKWLISKYPSLADIDTIPYNKATFMTNTESVMQGYINSEPLIMSQKSIPVKTLKVSDTGFNPYTSVLISSQKLFQSEPELLEKMKQASIKGWLSYLQSPEQTNAYIEKINPATKGTLNDSTKSMMQLMNKQNDSFGGMSPERWSALAKQLKNLGIIEQVPQDLEAILK